MTVSALEFRWSSTVLPNCLQNSYYALGPVQNCRCIITILRLVWIFVPSTYSTVQTQLSRSARTEPNRSSTHPAVTFKASLSVKIEHNSSLRLWWQACVALWKACISHSIFKCSTIFYANGKISLIRGPAQLSVTSHAGRAWERGYGKIMWESQLKSW